MPYYCLIYLGVVVHIHNLSFAEAKVGGFEELKANLGYIARFCL